MQPQPHQLSNAAQYIPNNAQAQFITRRNWNVRQQQQFAANYLHQHHQQQQLQQQQQPQQQVLQFNPNIPLAMNPSQANHQQLFSQMQSQMNMQGMPHMGSPIAPAAGQPQPVSQVMGSPEFSNHSFKSPVSHNIPISQASTPAISEASPALQPKQSIASTAFSTIKKFMEFSDSITPPPNHDISYWKQFVEKYFSTNATLKFRFNKSPTPKIHVLSHQMIPHFFYHHFDGNSLSTEFKFGSIHDKISSDGNITLECPRAVYIISFKDRQIVHKSEIKVTFNEELRMNTFELTSFEFSQNVPSELLDKVRGEKDVNSRLKFLNDLTKIPCTNGLPESLLRFLELSEIMFYMNDIIASSDGGRRSAKESMIFRMRLLQSQFQDNPNNSMPPPAPSPMLKKRHSNVQMVHNLQSPDGSMPSPTPSDNASIKSQASPQLVNAQIKSSPSPVLGKKKLSSMDSETKPKRARTTTNPRPRKTKTPSNNSTQNANRNRKNEMG